MTACGPIVAGGESEAASVDKRETQPAHLSTLVFRLGDIRMSSRVRTSSYRKPEPVVNDIEPADARGMLEIPFCLRCLALGAFFGALVGVGTWELGRAVLVTLASR